MSSFLKYSSDWTPSFWISTICFVDILQKKCIIIIMIVIIYKSTTLFKTCYHRFIGVIDKQ